MALSFATPKTFLQNESMFGAKIAPSPRSASAPLSPLFDLPSHIPDLGFASHYAKAQDLHLISQIKGLASQAILCLLILGEVLGSGPLGFSGSLLQPQSTLLLMVQQLAGQLGLPPQGGG